MIIPLEQYSKNAILFSTDKYIKKNNIIINNSNWDSASEIINASAYEEPHSVFQYPCIKLTGLDPGEYEFYAANDLGTELSSPMNVYITGDDKQKIIKNAAFFLNKRDYELYNNIAYDVSDKTNIIKYIYELINKEEDENKKYDIILLLRSILDIYNIRIRYSIPSAKQFNINESTKIITVNPKTVKVIQYNIFGDEPPRQYIISPGNSTTKIYENENSVYLFTEIDENGYPTNFVLQYAPDLETYNRIKNEQIANTEAYYAVIEKNILYPSSYLEFSEEERIYLALIDKLQEKNIILNTPDISIQRHMLTVDIDDWTYNFIKASNKDIYLSIVETELCLNPNDVRRLKIEFQNFNIHFSVFKILDENYFFWLEDEHGNKLSEIKTMILDSNGINISSEDLSDDLNNRIRKLNIYNYTQHLYPYINNMYPSTYEKISEQIDISFENETINISNIERNIFNSLCTVQNMAHFTNIARCILEDRLLYGKYRAEFFEEPIIYRYKNNTIVMPDRSNLLYAFEKYSIANGYTIEYIISDPIKATEYRFEDCDYGIVRAFDLDGFISSGFIFIDFSKNKIKNNIYQYLLDTVEVVNY